VPARYHCGLMADQPPSRPLETTVAGLESRARTVLPTSDSFVVGASLPRDDSSFKERYRRINDSRGGGFLYSRVVSERGGMIIAAISEPLGVHPTVLTFANLVFGVTGSLVVTLGAGARAISVTGFVGLVLWQLAYCFDCADGQLARATGKTTPGGAVLDPLIDEVVQTSVLVALISVIVHFSHPPIWVVVVIVAAWWINFFIFLLKTNDESAVPSLLPSLSFAIQSVKLIRDYGFLALVLGAWVTFVPKTLIYPVVAITAINVLLSGGTMVKAAQMSFRATANYPRSSAKERVP
jgi:phosphatidylglycerophosphate synthase